MKKSEFIQRIVLAKCCVQDTTLRNDIDFAVNTAIELENMGVPFDPETPERANKIFPAKGEPGFMAEGVYRNRAGREVTVASFYRDGCPWAALSEDGYVVETFNRHGDVLQGESSTGDLMERIR